MSTHVDSRTRGPYVDSRTNGPVVDSRTSKVKTEVEDKK